MCVCFCLLLQQSQFVFHHHVRLAHHFTTGWIWKGADTNTAVRSHDQTANDVVKEECKSYLPLRISSKPMESSLPRRVSTARFELCKNGRRWIWKDEHQISNKWKGRGTSGFWMWIWDMQLPVWLPCTPSVVWEAREDPGCFGVSRN